ncbi:hypothetical protein LAZ40_04770 [Cereibacter sphaeroides]|uniref:hypothetical protein n=1 Tax=Cereibacter sphaeroides TaxID=1063 RepID=UPI001F435962|nr:hypothetical protein [Cereibacter sphaeroides]MCE6958369.1 hypothetical protein [Cereibacter sphaeroides]MCE6972236.1 hypothetical protein [Cereibacter sphaeroides]
MHSLTAIIVFGLMLAVCLFGLGKSSRGASATNATGPFNRSGSAGTGRSDDHPILQAADAGQRPTS